MTTHLQIVADHSDGFQASYDICIKPDDGEQPIALAYGDQGNIEPDEIQKIVKENSSAETQMNALKALMVERGWSIRKAGERDW